MSIIAQLLTPRLVSPIADAAASGEHISIYDPRAVGREHKRSHRFIAAFTSYYSPCWFVHRVGPLNSTRETQRERERERERRNESAGETSEVSSRPSNGPFIFTR